MCVCISRNVTFWCIELSSCTKNSHYIASLSHCPISKYRMYESPNLGLKYRLGICDVYINSSTMDDRGCNEKGKIKSPLKDQGRFIPIQHHSTNWVFLTLFLESNSLKKYSPTFYNIIWCVFTFAMDEFTMTPQIRSPKNQTSDTDFL